MRINEAGLKIIKRNEGLRLHAYRCPAGVWTIGYGHTGPAAKRGNIITEERADLLLRNDVAYFEDAVSGLVTVPLNGNQFSALVSFTFNLGEAHLAESTLLRTLNAGDPEGAANEFPRWNRAGGKVLPGLERRRDEERALFLTPVEGWSIWPK